MRVWLRLLKNIYIVEYPGKIFLIVRFAEFFSWNAVFVSMSLELAQRKWSDRVSKIARSRDDAGF